MFSDPQNNIDQFNVDPGHIVADLGAGSGHYSIALARAVESAGKVFAIDIQQDMLSKIKNEAKSLGIQNIEILWGDIEEAGGTKLQDKSIDRAVVSNTLFQVEDKLGFAKEIKRIIKPNGKLLVVDWSESFGGLGPQINDVVSPEDAVKIFESEDFEVEKEINAGENHYGIIFKLK